MATSSSLSSPPLAFTCKPKSPHFFKTSKSTSPTFTLSTTISPRRTIHFQNPPQSIHQNRTHLWKISAISEDTVTVPPSDSTIPFDSGEQLISSTKTDGVSTTISVLLFIAFVGLSVLTIGVIYIAVTDYLQKREGEKFEKEEAAKKKGGKKKGKVKTRAGPKGFGQKLKDIDDEFSDD